MPGRSWSVVGKGKSKKLKMTSFIVSGRGRVLRNGFFTTRLIKEMQKKKESLGGLIQSVNLAGNLQEFSHEN